MSAMMTMKMSAAAKHLHPKTAFVRPRAPKSLCNPKASSPNIQSIQVKAKEVPKDASLAFSGGTDSIGLVIWQASTSVTAPEMTTTLSAHFPNAQVFHLKNSFTPSHASNQLFGRPLDDNLHELGGHGHCPLAIGLAPAPASIPLTPELVVFSGFMPPLIVGVSFHCEITCDTVQTITM